MLFLDFLLFFSHKYYDAYLHFLGYFALYYGGSIFQGIDEETDTLYHVFRLIDTTADVIVGINLYNYKMTISGITNLRHIHNLSYIRANNTCYN